MLSNTQRDWQAVCARITQQAGLSQLVGADPTFLDAITRIQAIAASDAPVLIVGETGTGKELCAHAIHHLSPRAHFPFIPVECGAVPDLLAENELFGHARGAYTDAHRDQKGLAALAEGGTLFLDEIDSLSLAAQAKLLRFLQDGAYRALGAERFVRANVRVLAAANRDVELLVQAKQFRSDLYFRLNVLELQLPPLRERRRDISLLANHFLESFCAAAGGPARYFSPAALRILEQHDWPGNVRELRNVIHRAVIFSSGASILPSHICLRRASPPTPAAISFRQARQQAIDRFERLYLEQTLREHGGNITRAALAAGKDRRAFGRLVKKHGVDPRTV
jgi:two-component system response regulator GlrR